MANPLYLLAGATGLEPATYGMSSRPRMSLSEDRLLKKAEQERPDSQRAGQQRSIPICQGPHSCSPATVNCLGCPRAHGCVKVPGICVPAAFAPGDSWRPVPNPDQARRVRNTDVPHLQPRARTPCAAGPGCGTKRPERRSPSKARRNTEFTGNMTLPCPGLGSS